MRNFTSLSAAAALLGSTQLALADMCQCPCQYTTKTITTSVPKLTTVTVAQATGTTPGTVYVESPYPTSYVTTTTITNVDHVLTTTIAQQVGTTPGTVYVESPFPTSFVTKTTTTNVDHVITTTVAQQVGTTPGTVLIEEPSLCISKSSASQTTGTSVPPPQPTGSCQVTTPQCNNAGLNYNVYKNINGDWKPATSSQPGYANFTPTDYMNATPSFSGVSTSLLNISYAPISQGTVDVYGHSIPSNYWVISYTGYFFACQTGTYKFTSYNADDIVLIWLGPLATSGWTRANAALEQVYADPPQGFTGFPGEGPVSFTAKLNAGEYYPLRIMYANAQRQAQFHLYAYDPQGGQVVAPGVDSGVIFSGRCGA